MNRQITGKRILTRTLLLLLICSLALSSCTNGLIAGIESLRIEAVSPEIEVTTESGRIFSPGDNIDYSQISVGETYNITLQIANRGKTILFLDNSEMGITMDSGTEEGTFSLFTAPSSEIAIGDTTTLVLCFSPQSEGEKSATVTLHSNDYNNPEISFTLIGAGSVVTLATDSIVNNIGMNSATGSGEVISDGGTSLSLITERGICWSTDPNPTIDDNSVRDGGVGLGSYSCLMTGLSAGTFYYIRAYAVQNFGTSYGSQVSFETLPQPPSGPSVSPVPYSAGSGKLDVSWTSANGPFTYYDVYFSTSAEAPDLPNGPTDISATSCTLTGLTDYTNYNVWIKAKNATGSSDLSQYGTSIVGVKVLSISLDRSPQTLIFNSNETVVATCYPLEATNKNISWTTSNGAIASVADGVISVGTTVGVVTITAASADGQGAFSNITPAAKAFVLYDSGPAGGLLLHDKGSYTEGWRFLEMANENVGGGHTWYNGTYITIPGAVSHDFGAGKENTDAIIAAQGSGEYMAMDCRSYTINGYSDWYMPSAGEANEIIGYLGANIPGLWGVYSSSQKSDDKRACFVYSYSVDSWGWGWIYTSSSAGTGVTRPVRRF